MSTSLSTQETDWQDWHSAREMALATPHGWLSLTSFHWLTDEPSSFDSLPGHFRVDDGQAVLAASAADGYRVRGDGAGTEVDGAVRAQVAEAASLEWLTLGDVMIELARRGGRYAIRTRDPKAPALQGFTGIPAFDLDSKWLVKGTFAPFDEPRTIQVNTARDDLIQYVTGVGTVTVALPAETFARPAETVDLGGRSATLIATAGSAGTLNIAFHDPTNHDTTAPWRAVGTSAPDADGRVAIDFNRAINFPFAFSDYGTCPAPPPGNTLPVPVTAGERAPSAVSR